MISSASPWLMGTWAESGDTFELADSRASQVTEAMSFTVGEPQRRVRPRTDSSKRCAGRLDARYRRHARGAAADSTSCSHARSLEDVASVLVRCDRGHGSASPRSDCRSVGELHAGIDGQARSFEAGRVLVMLIEQIVDAAKGLDVLVDLVVRRQIDHRVTRLRDPD